MPKRGSVMIDTVPLPDKGSVMIDTVPLPERVVRRVKIPMKLIREFEGEIVIYPDPYPVGIILAHRFADKLDVDLRDEFEIMIIPKR